MQDGNNYSNGNQMYSHASVQEVERCFMGRVYNWMTMGLAISAISAWQVAEWMRQPGSVFRNSGTIIILCLLELGFVFAISGLIKKMSPAVATGCFLVYSVLSGMTLAPIFLAYTMSTISTAFFSCAGMFALTSLYGYTTKKNLMGIGSICMMGLIGIIIATLINLFFHNDMLTMVISYIGVAVFIGLTAWDTQKLRQMVSGMDEDELESGDMKKLAVLGALTLYLDFINIFLMLLRIFGGGNRR